MSRLASLAAALTLLLSAARAPVAAQQVAGVAVGQRLRVVTHAREQVTGQLHAVVPPDTLVLAIPGRGRRVQFTVPASQIRELYVSGGGPRRRQRAAIGMVVGAAVGAVLGVMSVPSDGLRPFPRGFAAALLGGVGGAVGAVVGATVGGERWERVR